MEHYAGIDVSLEESSVCVVDATGKLVREVKVASEPEALVRYFVELELPVSRIGLEAGPLIAMAACQPCSRRTRCCVAGDTARESGTLGHDGQDRPERCARDRPAAADGVVPSGSREIGAL